MEKEIMEWLKSIVVALILGVIITTFAQPTIVRGPSMEPTLQNYNLLLVNRALYKLKEPSHGDIVVFKFEVEKKNLIKRVIGVAGDTVEISSGIVYVNGSELEEVYLGDIDISSKDLQVVVPRNSVFVLGDNRNDSKDSRSTEVGTVNKELILGKAYLRLFPFNKLGRIR